MPVRLITKPNEEEGLSQNGETGEGLKQEDMENEREGEETIKLC